ncbi:hypothetical protein CROQUDRAFT_666365 [Cronartium quercuum f. sp. fusiforme G11]|uniref:WIBG Mago-binding domain-containing protein n=1 Tax=Cronartium quercuum f. sp. fusiforme G11 TaxID=708437 RepID=A0A9P6N857_9BASI|nr:hypothetical protein CROQUDRAFT_666365 [Cronartium quercuum f. sp. fusiforme G11]
MSVNSRPPLHCELKPTTSGIIEDPNTGKRLVAASKRPDGTLRKEIRIRPGYTPQEDVSKFRSARQQQYHATDRPKGSVIGLTRPTSNAAQAALKGMSDAQKKNAKRKQKRNTTTNQSGVTDETPEDWDRASVENNVPEESAVSPDDHSSSEQVKPINKSPAPTSSEAPNLNISNPGSTLFKTALKSSSSNPQVPLVQQFVPTKAPSVPQSDKPRTPKIGAEDRGAKLFGTALQNLDRGSLSPDADTETLEKKTRATRKKLIQAEQLRTRLSEGDELLPEQLEKISKIDELKYQLENMSI